MPKTTQVQKYLQKVHNTRRIKVNHFGPLSEYETSSKKKSTGKRMGYGDPYLVIYDRDGKSIQSIISTVRITYGFGHDFRADRAASQILEFDTWGKLPKHCGVEDLGAFDKDSSMISMGKAQEFFVLRPKIEGVEYLKDLDRIYSTGYLESHDLSRAKALAEYLVRIHSKKYKGKGAGELYLRKIRDTVGHGECIFGLADSYPVSSPSIQYAKELEKIEKKCVEQRWNLRTKVHRLCQVHGDFHPANILFSQDIARKPNEFQLLDRSRGEWGEPADDVCALSINYIFGSIRKYGKLSGEYSTLFQTFINTYLDETSDKEMLEEMPLFYTFRALVIASPIWYPNLTDECRRAIFRFARKILDSGVFDPTRVNEYLTAAS